MVGGDQWTRCGTWLHLHQRSQEPGVAGSMPAGAVMGQLARKPGGSALGSLLGSPLQAVDG